MKTKNAQRPQGKRLVFVWSGGRRKEKAKFPPQARLLLVIYGMFAAANALSGTFVGIYLWKIKSDFSVIAAFAAAQQVSMSATFWLAGKRVKEGNKMNILRLGIAASAVFYILVLWLGPASVRWILPLGVVQGLAAGLFWLAYNVAYFEVTGPLSRDRFNGWSGFLSSAAGMAAPMLSGFLITRMSDATGYRLIFSLSLGVFLAGAVFSFFLKKRKTSGRYDWLLPFRLLRSEGGVWPRYALAMAAQGVREGVFAFLVGLLVFIATGNELKLGAFTLIASFAGLTGFYLAGRLLKPRYRKFGMLAGLIAINLAILPLFWRVSFGTLLFFGIGTALFFPLYMIPATSVSFDLIGRSRESAKQRVEFVVLREVSLNAGRLAGTLTFLLMLRFTSAPAAIHTLLLAAGCVPFATWFLMLPWLKRPAADTAGNRQV